MHSAIYCGWLSHRRHLPRPHAFRYRLFMMYLDLAELDDVFRGRWLWSTTRAAPARFDRRDHFGDPSVPLDEAVRDLVAQRSGERPAGPIRLLTHLRYFGYVFNPVSFYYCFDAQDRRVETIVAEVTNTPWGERHCYVMRNRADERGMLRSVSAKAMHVSPFHPMALNYHWAFDLSDERLGVGMALLPAEPASGRPVFHARLQLRRMPIRARSLAMVLLRFPLMTAQVIAAIHWQALLLWCKRVPVHEHPSAHTGRATADPTSASGES